MQLPVTEYDQAHPTDRTPTDPAEARSVDELVAETRFDLLADLMANNGHPYSRPRGYPSRPESGPVGESGVSRSH